MSSDRLGEKIGWIGGWTGAFLWVLILGIVKYIQGATVDGVIGFIIAVDAIVMIVIISPWRYPTKPYWILMLSPYFSLALSIAWAIWTFSGGGEKINPYMFGWVVILAMPLIMMGKRRWSDNEK